eukprot:scaffold4361_cov341-Prasinococcus_capsulatus_cf.AAC.2
MLKTLLAVITGALVAAVLLLLGVDMALVFGVITFVLKYIPEAGPIVAVLLPLPLVLVSPNTSTGTLLLSILLPALIHAVMGNLVEVRG